MDEAQAETEKAEQPAARNAIPLANYPFRHLSLEITLSELTFVGEWWTIRTEHEVALPAASQPNPETGSCPDWRSFSP
jgi:hypothetical protein